MLTLRRPQVKNPLQRISLDDVANHPFLLRAPHVLGKRRHGAAAPLPPYPDAEEVRCEAVNGSCLELRRSCREPSAASFTTLIAHPVTLCVCLTHTPIAGEQRARAKNTARPSSSSSRCMSLR